MARIDPLRPRILDLLAHTDRSDMVGLVTVALIGGLILLLRLLAAEKARLTGRPPGPRGLPLFGNLFQVPMKHFGTYLKQLHSTHGELVYLNMNGSHVFSVATQALASELLDRRSTIYSSRSQFPFWARYIDPSGLIWAFTTPGENHYWGRKLSTTAMKSVRAGDTESLQYLQAVGNIQKLLQVGDQDSSNCEWHHHIARMNASTIVTAMFGVNPLDDPISVDKVLELTESVTLMAAPFSSFINFVPFVDDLIPSWIPTPWRKRGAQWVQHDRREWGKLLQEAVEGRGAGLNHWAAVFASEKTLDGDRRLLLPIFAAAAIETTTTTLHSFVLACLAYPGWIASAQDQLDRVVGKDRLPRFSDRPSLPLIEAVVRELLRWNPPLRAGIPHKTTTDDVLDHRGHKYLIPKGSTIYFSSYAIEYDRNRIEEPRIFKPERYLERGELRTDYQTSVFGFGRRLCVGIPFVERTLWISVATILWTFNIRNVVDPQTGSPRPCDLSDDACFAGLTCDPFPFPAIFEPRDDARVAVARREWEELDKDLSALLPLSKNE